MTTNYRLLSPHSERGGRLPALHMGCVIGFVFVYAFLNFIPAISCKGLFDPFRLLSFSTMLENIGGTFDHVCVMASYTRTLFKATLHDSGHPVAIPTSLSCQNIEDAHHIACITARAMSHRGMIICISYVYFI